MKNILLVETYQMHHKCVCCAKSAPRKK